MTAVSIERARLAGELHDRAGQVFVAMGLLARRHADDLPAGSQERTLALRLAALADEGRWELEQVIRGLNFAPSGQGELAYALGALVESVSLDSGIDVSVRIDGDSEALDPGVQQALYRIAHQAVMNAWRHAQCQHIAVTVIVSESDATLRVADDGSGLPEHAPAEGMRLGVVGMRRAAAGVGGTLRICPGRERGLVVEVVVQARGEISDASFAVTQTVGGVTAD